MPNDPFYSTPQWRRTRQRVLERDGHICQIQLAGCTIKATHCDHIIPKADLPPNSPQLLDPSNLRAACAFCNSARSNPKQRRHYLPSRHW